MINMAWIQTYFFCQLLLALSEGQNMIGQNNTVNKAIGKTCEMSTVYSGSNCKNAIDDNLDQVNNFAHTAGNDFTPRWSVDLRDYYFISHIIVYPRNNSETERMKNVIVAVDNETVYPFDQPTNQITTIRNINRRGKNITLYKLYKSYTATYTNYYLVLCEVQVYVCSQGFYGNGCIPCGHCSDGSQPCNTTDGVCPNGCAAGWQGSTCQVCSPGFYGIGCAPCGHCTDGSQPCNTTDGFCPNGCAAGWQGNTCQEACTDGTYGVNCKDICGFCTEGKTMCNKTDGKCPTKCQAGYMGERCQQNCSKGNYGEMCANKCGACSGGNDSCDIVNGKCPSGCQPGYLGEQCHQTCPKGNYGDMCTNVCGACNGGNDSCDVANGKCLSGCQPGYRGEQCNQSCGNWTFGQDCSESCGQCLDITCNITTGVCPKGCTTTIYGNDYCKVSDTSTPTQPINALAVGVGVGVGGAVLIVVVVVVIILMRRRKLSKETGNSSTNMRNGSELVNEPVSRFSYNGDSYANNKPKSTLTPASNTDNLNHVYSNVTPPAKAVAAKIPSAEKLQKAQRSGSERSSENTDSRDRVYENATIQKPLVLPKKSRSREAMKEEVDESFDERDEYNNEDIYAGYQSVIPKPELDSLQRYLLDRLASGELSTEFEAFPKGMVHEHKIAATKDNIGKNRFKALFPYDHSRVILHRPNGDTNTDFIHANYIKGVSKDNAYIATQGPKPNTIDDFWLMVWQEKISQIVMLTNLCEDGKDKCAEYWPQAGTSKTCGHVTVTGVQEVKRADFIIRSFRIKFLNGGKPRNVDQYHYSAWPDHGVPTTISLVNFWRYIKMHPHPLAPLLVHCSAGIGRTGTYIGLDIASDLMAESREVNVNQLVRNMREDRPSMVQSQAQYKFLYEVILEAHTSRETRMTSDNFKTLFPDGIDVTKQNPHIDYEFKVLKQMCELVSKPTYDMAKEAENRNKNRSPDVLPDDAHLVYLNIYQRDRNQYINAVYIPTFHLRKGIILTQLPLPDTMVDLWRLVDGCGIKTIVSISANNEENSVKNYCTYWPRAIREDKTIGTYTIRTVEYNALSDYLDSYRIRFQSKSIDNKEVRLLHYTGWTEEEPASTKDIIHLAHTVQEERDEDDSSPILVQCIDGAQRSGMFCVIYDIINRITSDHEVDVYMAVRQAKSVRPEVVSNELQYRFCYKTADDVIKQIQVYANT